ncbi:MAG TPA: pyridoxal-phosphate dependent enzyme [Polyangium sp.]|nr:pyridoxal-phosphate dependent enzyme [Polyangium sp.]
MKLRSPSVLARPMSLRLSRRAFSSLALGSFWGCNDVPQTTNPSAPASSPILPSIAEAAPRGITSKTSDVPLFRAFPRIAERVPRLALGEFPTPVERTDKLGGPIGISNLWIKRDDLSGVLYGGGKTRKLEFYLADAKARNAREVVTFGAYGSNQAVATALWGKARGFAVRLLLAPQMPSKYVQKNLYAMHRAGAIIEVVRDGVGAAAMRMQEKLNKSREQGTYLIPAGGSSPLGNVAFVNAALELAEQVRAGVCPAPDCIYLAMGTMGSAVGLWLGLELTDLKTEIVAVRASSAETSSESRFRAMAKETLSYLRSLDPAFPELPLDRRRVRFHTRQLGGGYGFATRPGAAAMQIFEERQGYSLEPTYTAKALAALIADAKTLAKKTVLFWNSHNTRFVATDGVGPEYFSSELRNYLRQVH